jgi:hypothetical protein
MKAKEETGPRGEFRGVLNTLNIECKNPLMPYRGLKKIGLGAE